MGRAQQTPRHPRDVLCGACDGCRGNDSILVRNEKDSPVELFFFVASDLRRERREGIEQCRTPARAPNRAHLAVPDKPYERLSTVPRGAMKRACSTTRALRTSQCVARGGRVSPRTMSGHRARFHTDGFSMATG